VLGSVSVCMWGGMPACVCVCVCVCMCVCVNEVCVCGGMC